MFSSCRTRLGDFLFGGDIDMQSTCTSACSLDQVATVPSTTLYDANATARPWIESVGGQTNLADGVSVTDALRCVVPQGVNGCGFESQLESAYLAIARSQSNAEASYGFTDPSRLLVVVFVTDEADCSYNKNFSTIFEADGNKAFWSDPNASFPTSAVCWNAGVTCAGDPSGYSSCEPTDKDVNGGLAGSPDDAVLLPMGRYMQGYKAAGPVVTFAIAGVGTDGEPFYADVGNTDPSFQNSFGIGPGCTTAAGNEIIQAVPPVRLRAVLDELGPEGGQAAYSICSPSLSGGLGGIGVTVAGML